jgi:hypothetical protein
MPRGEQIQNLGEYAKKGSTPWMKGKHHTEKSKQLIGSKAKGRKVSEETRKKLSIAGKGRIPTNISSGDKHPRWKGGLPKCQVCGIQLRGYKAKFCTTHKNIGDTNPNWKGGLSFLPYASQWTETLKRSIRERDNYICQICSQYGYVVHHIDYDKKNCNPNNLITLCNVCHSQTNGKREHWKQYFNNLINK